MPNADPGSLTTRRIILIILALVLVGAIFFATRSRETPPIPPQPEAPAVNLSDPLLEVRRLSGTVAALTDRGLILDVPSILGVSLDENSPLRIREIIIASATRIVARAEKDDDRYAQELEAYYEKRAKGEQAFPPSSSNETVISKSSLKVGDAIQVVGVQDEDIKEMNPIIAGSIEKQ